MLLSTGLAVVILFSELVHGDSGTGELLEWNGLVVSGPNTLVFHDELHEISVVKFLYRTNSPNTRGLLICSHPTLDVSWYDAGGVRVKDSTSSDPADFRQFRINSNRTSYLGFDRSGIDRRDAATNGAWSCRTRGLIFTRIPIYKRGLAAVTGITMYVTGARNTSQQPVFSVTGDATGGFPTNYTWTRNGKAVGSVDNRTFEISYVHRTTRSTLTVRGNYPGVYKCYATNRDTPVAVEGTQPVEGYPPDDYLVQQVDFKLNNILASWSPPLAPPRAGYRVTLEPTGMIYETTSSQKRFTIKEPGTYVVRVQSLSQHLPSPTVEQKLTVRVLNEPEITHISATQTSVTITWTLPQLSLIPASYVLSITGSHTTFTKTVGGEVTSFEFTDLRVSNDYTVTVTASIKVFGQSIWPSTSKKVSTLGHIHGAITEVGSETGNSTSVVAPVVAGAVVGVLLEVGVVAVVLVVLAMRKRYKIKSALRTRRRNKNSSSDSDSDSLDFRSGVGSSGKVVI